MINKISEMTATPNQSMLARSAPYLSQVDPISGFKKISNNMAAVTINPPTVPLKPDVEA